MDGDPEAAARRPPRDRDPNDADILAVAACMSPGFAGSIPMQGNVASAPTVADEAGHSRKPRYGRQ